MDERDFLEQAADTYKTDGSAISKWSIDSYIRIYSRYIKKPGYGLELGCSSGYSTERLSQLVRRLDVVDGSKKMLAKCKQFDKKVTFLYALFEELDIREKYDFIFCSYVLEHVMSPRQILEVCHSGLRPAGMLFITVPNATALSRQMALEMNLLSSLYELTENDLAHGHRRVFDRESLMKLVGQSGFRVIDTGGTFLKPFADFQMNQMIAQKIIGGGQLRAMQKMAQIYPELSGSIYAVLERS